MEDKKKAIKELCEGLGWIDMGNQKNPWLISFKQEETGRRVDIYFTTMTVVLHDKEFNQKPYYHIDTLDRLELLLKI